MNPDAEKVLRVLPLPVPPYTGPAGVRRKTENPDLEHDAWSLANWLEACADHLRPPLEDAEPPAGDPPSKGTVTSTHPDGTADTMVKRVRRALARFGREYLESCAYLCPLIPEYFPKGTEITGDMDYLWSVADSLNDRPRAIFGFRKPSEVFAELLLQETVTPPA
jgi:hypothetical protein